MRVRARLAQLVRSLHDCIPGGLGFNFRLAQVLKGLTYNLAELLPPHCPWKGPLSRCSRGTCKIDLVALPSPSTSTITYLTNWGVRIISRYLLCSFLGDSSITRAQTTVKVIDESKEYPILS